MGAHKLLAAAFSCRVRIQWLFCRLGLITHFTTIQLRGGQEAPRPNKAKIRYFVLGRRRYDWRAMRGRECIRHDDKAASRVTPKGDPWVMFGGHCQ
jgi:hypothetical protein